MRRIAEDVAYLAAQAGAEHADRPVIPPLTHAWKSDIWDICKAESHEWAEYEDRTRETWRE